MMTIVKVVKAEALDGFMVRLEFSDGFTKTMSLEPYLHGPIFEPMRKHPEMFRALMVDYGTVAWSNGADIDPLVLRYDLTPAWMEDTGGGKIDTEAVHR
jgi:hypothetical protein